MKFIFLGTGTASAEKIYHTCFLIEKQGNFVLVDGGGGNGILSRLSEANIDVTKINHIFLSHIHLDHCLGILWVIRKRKWLQENSAPLYIYGNQEVLDEFSQLIKILLKREAKNIGKSLILEPVQDGERKNICEIDFEFLDTKASKNTMYGFIVHENGKRFVFVGDETIKPEIIKKIKGCDLLMHDAIGLEGEFDDDFFKRTCHSTPKLAGTLAAEAQAKSLLIFHTTDKNFEQKTKKYKEEASKTFSGKIYVPNDLDVVEIE